MEILLRDIPDQGLDIDYEADPDLLDLVDQAAGFLGFKDKIVVRGSLNKIGETVLLAGWLTARLILLCSRCAKDFVFLLHQELVAQFLPLAQASMQRPNEKNIQDEPEE